MCDKEDEYARKSNEVIDREIQRKDIEREKERERKRDIARYA